MKYLRDFFIISQSIGFAKMYIAKTAVKFTQNIRWTLCIWIKNGIYERTLEPSNEMNSS